MIDLNRQPLTANTFQDELLDFLKRAVPKILITDNSWTAGSFKHNEVSNQVLNQIAWWLFEGDQGDVLPELAKLNNPSTICGHVFKAGEAAYTCRECAMDPTCVLCQTCFRKSAHINHKYKLHSSTGGGCCDCGDFEAWTNFPCCEKHTVISSSTTVDARLKLPPAVRDRAEKVFRVLFEYIIDSLTVDRTESNQLPANLTLDTVEDTFVTVVFNDESHTFDYVIEVLQRATACSESTASDYATIIDREGRTVVVIGSYVNCMAVKDKITENNFPAFPLRRRIPLMTKVLHSSVMAHQEFSVTLLLWMNKISKQSEGLRNIIADIMLQRVGGDETKNTYVTEFMLADTKLWKVARNAYEQTVMSSVFLQNETKKLFGIEYTRIYETLIANFLVDDHEHSDCITSISVQVFTVPTIVKHLVTEEGLLRCLLGAITSNMCMLREPGSDDTAPLFRIHPRYLRKNINRLQFCFYDLKYALTNVPTEWDVKLREQFRLFFRLFVAFLASLQGMNATARKTLRHVETEPEWETGVTLQLRFAFVVNKIMKWCSSSKEVVSECLEEILRQMTRLDMCNHNKVSISFEDTEYECIDYDVTTQPVSVHYPLTRLAAALLVEFGRLNLPLAIPSITGHIFSLTEYSFRALSLCAQAVAGAWVRNGMALANQVYYSKDHLGRSESLNRDIQMLQACAALSDPDHFCIALHHKMNLRDPDTLREYLPQLYESYVSYIIYVCVERFTEGVGQATYEDRLRREVIHVLAGGPKPHSKIQKYLSHEVSNKPGWEAILHEVADHKPSTNTKTVAKYELKADFLQYVSPCFYHYSTASEQNNAHSEVLRKKKANNQSTVFIPRVSPPFTDSFARAINVLQSSFLINFLKVLLQKFQSDTTASMSLSDKLLDKILYLVGYAVVEEREKVKVDQDDDFKFCEKAEQGGLLPVLRELSGAESMTIHRENICWLLNAVTDANKRRIGIVDDVVVDCTPTRKTFDNNERRKRKQVADKIRSSLVEQMKSLQKKFVEQNQMEVEEPTQVDAPPEVTVTESETEKPVCTSLSWQLSSLKKIEDVSMCILCQDDTRSHECLVMSAFAQMSSVLSKRRVPPAEAVKHIGSLTNPAGICISTCSHVMHFECWGQYFESVRERRPHRMRRSMMSFSTLKKEFLCPLCSRLSNCVLPAVFHTEVAKQRGLSPTISDSMPVQEWMRIINDVVDIPPSVKQEVVIRLHADASSENDEWFDVPDTFPDEEDSSSLDVVPMSQDAPEVITKHVYETALKGMVECLKKNCVDKDDDAVLWYTAVTTFQVAESVARLEEKPLMAPPSVRLEQTLFNTIRCCCISTKYMQGKESDHEKFFKIILGKCTETSVLETNVFHTFVRLIFACECMQKNKGVSFIDNDRNILFLCALAQIVQIILFIDVNEITGESSGESPLVNLFNQVRSYAQLPPILSVCQHKLESCISTSFDPFLRSCALLMRYLTNVAPSAELEERDDRKEMLHYLGLPADLFAYFDANGTASLEPLVQRWCSHSAIIEKCKSFDVQLSFPRLARLNRLIELDEDYSDIIAKSSEFQCPRFGGEDDSVYPAICLVCGAVLCSQSYCCQQELNGVNVGACTYHTYQCSFGHGLFLRGRDCTVILLNESRGSLRAAPYLDEYGETDQGLRRGNPLRLDTYRMKELNLLWLNHAVSENISREMEINRSLFNMEWNHM